MSWLRRQQIRKYLRDSIWILPLLGMVAAFITVRALDRVDQLSGSSATLDPGTAQVVLATLASSMFTFIVFVSSVLLLALQLASAQLTPRIVAFLFRDPVTKWALAAFVFTFTFVLTALIRVKVSVPPLTARCSAYASMASLVIFLYLIDHVGRSLRANGALRAVGRIGSRVIEAVYPRPLESNPLPGSNDVPTAAATRTVFTENQGAVLAFDIRGLMALADRHTCVIEVVPQVGDFLAAGCKLFRIYEGGAELPDVVLHQSIWIGPERTFEQDPGFALRIIVDIATKALSPAINDPTTAVLALDEIHHLLRNVGNRHLDERALSDSNGKVRLVYHTPDWSDFLSLAVTEIRQYGGESIQIARRLRAMLENLIQTLPEIRRPALQQELALLRRSADRFFTEPEDRAMAEVSDPQGVGGRHQNEGEPSRK